MNDSKFPCPLNEITALCDSSSPEHCKVCKHNPNNELPKRTATFEPRPVPTDYIQIGNTRTYTHFRR